MSSPAPGRTYQLAPRGTPRGRTGLRCCLGLSLALLLIGCAAQELQPNKGYESSRAGRLFTMGYQDVSDIYIENVQISDLALAGLESLSGIDPAVGVQRSGDTIALTVSGKPLRSFAAPGRNDADGWGNLTAQAIDAGRAGSPSLDAARSEGLYQAVFDGLTSQLDSFSRYAGREEANEHRASREGFGGIGVRISLVDDGVKILSVMENTPSEEAGLKDLDVITHIDGQPTVGLTQREVVRRLRGPIDSRVALLVKRESDPGRAHNVVVTRGHIVPQTVKYEADGNIGYIRVSGFNQSTARTLQSKIRLAQEELGPKLAGLVIDLRNNPGGLLDQAVAVSDHFVSHGRIVSTHGRHPDSHQYFDADSDELVPGIPVAVLINGNSASASEIVAAALQDAGRAVVIGSSSFGKGTVQTVLRLPNEGELTLTWARFHAPSGYGLHGRGVLPDICTSGRTSSGEVLDRLRRGDLQPLDPSIRGRNVDPNDEQAIEAIRAHCPIDEGDNELDLKVAEAVLVDPLLYARVLRGGHMNAAQAQQTGVSASSN